jgi:pimeloyl-ACP methyl ester carboxylesterase
VRHARENEASLEPRVASQLMFVTEVPRRVLSDAADHRLTDRVWRGSGSSGLLRTGRGRAVVLTLGSEPPRWKSRIVIRITMVAAAAILIAVAGSSCSASSGSGASPTTGRMKLKPCEVQGVAARCGTFVVPENRTKPNGRMIGLRVVVLPASSKPAATDAVTYLAGGPGDAATEEAAALSQQLVQVNGRRDILLVDQRGTGSTAYSCPHRSKPFSSNADLRAYTLGCLKAFGGEVNQYGTRAAMDDLDAVRAALGYRQLDIIGSSYGATAAQVYLKLHPSSVRTLTLDGATAIDVPIFGRWARNAQHALDQLAKLCDAQPGCQQAFPRWERQFGELAKAWNADPVQTRKGVSMTGDQLAGVIHVMLLDLQKAVSIPLVISRAAKGDYAPLNQQAPGDLGAPSPQLMAWSIWCNEPWAGLDAQGPWGTEFDSYTAAKIEGFRQGCAFFPKRAEPRSLWTFSSASRVPVLAFSGGADPQDPATNLSNLKQHFPDGHTVIFPHIGHQFGIGGCVDQTMADFIDRATTKGLDTTRCDGAVVVPPFTTRG